MEEFRITILGFGILCVAGAIVGGGLKAFGAALPVLSSITRQVLLGAFGIVLIVGSIVFLEEDGEGSQPGDSQDRVQVQASLDLPISTGSSGRALDLDAASLIPLGTSIPTKGADLVFSQAVHGIIIQPGPSSQSGGFPARFTRIGDSPGGRSACASAAIASNTAQALELGKDVIARISHVCMVTDQNRLSEFRVTAVRLEGQNRSVQIEFTTWSNP